MGVSAEYINNRLLEILELRGLPLSWPTTWSHRGLLEATGWIGHLRSAWVYWKWWGGSIIENWVFWILSSW